MMYCFVLSLENRGDIRTMLRFVRGEAELQYNATFCRYAAGRSVVFSMNSSREL